MRIPQVPRPRPTPALRLGYARTPPPAPKQPPLRRNLPCRLRLTSLPALLLLLLGAIILLPVVNLFRRGNVQ